MRLKILAISDTHLGNSVSLLSSARGRQYLGETLRQQFGAHDEVEVEELILAGDIIERAWAPLSETLDHARSFIETLRGVATIKKMVYLVGDHDHVVWTAYRKRLCGEDKPWEITGLLGDLLVEGGRRRDERESATELLSVFFDYPSGPLWKEIEQEKNLGFVIANPVYAKRIAQRTYLFTHGTHFRRDLVWPRWLKKLADLLIPGSRVLGTLRTDPGHDLRQADSLQELERIVASFVDGVRPAFEDNRTAPWLYDLLYLRAMLRGKFRKVREAPKKSRLFTRQELAQVPQETIRRLTADDQISYKPLKWWQKYFLPHMLARLTNEGFPQENLTFVFGDTHDGGWGELPLSSGGRVRIYNLGGWVLYDAREHPDCHVFALGECGEEYLLDVSFEGVEEGEISSSNSTMRVGSFPFRTGLKQRRPFRFGLLLGKRRPVAGKGPGASLRAVSVQRLKDASRQ